MVKHKCEGNCLETYGAHEPPTVPVVVTGTGFGAMRFNYCANAVKEDQSRGFKVVREASMVAYFVLMLKKFDWYFEMSDDPNVWDRGRTQKNEIEAHLVKFPFLQETYDKEKAKIFKNVTSQ